MFERVNDLSGSLIGGNDSEAELDAGPFAALLDNGERPEHVLASDSVEHTTEGRTTTVEPEGDHDAYLVVTDERLLVVLGDQPEVVEIAFDFESVTTCKLKSGFLNTKLVVGHETESIHFAPTDGDPDRVTDYIQNVADVYRSVDRSIGAARDVIDTLESKIEGETGQQRGTATQNLRLRARSQLSDARHQVSSLTDTHPLGDEGDDVLAEKLEERIESVARECDRRYVAVWLDRGETDIERAEDALAGEEFEPFCGAYTTAVRALSRLREAIDDVEATPDNAGERIDSLADRVEGLDEQYVSATTKTFEVAREADRSDVAATRWLEAYRRINAASEAGWNRIDGIATLDVAVDLSSIAASTLEALETHAEQLETTGEQREDEDAEDAREQYERAVDRLRDAQSVAETASSIDADDYEKQIDAIKEKIDRTKWEWGGD
ncbi:PH domain-containing protein [Halorhabdus sp. CUG00001]|uniref:PH domain-containing protein n=1 Tax=Halorhabdus sp. CUG00001 TaxID=2600297 RepID=UPI00131BA63A|nr:PH domain-containing protein [Halorhabdus sp. CUG00001]